MTGLREAFDGNDRMVKRRCGCPHPELEVSCSRAWDHPPDWHAAGQVDYRTEPPTKRAVTWPA